TRFYGQEKKWSIGLSAWKYCVFAGVCFGVPYMALAWLLGPEFPAMVGGLVGLAVLIWGTKRGFCVPAKAWNFGPQSTWEAEWTGSIATVSENEFKPHMSQFMAWLPYIIIGAILVATRIGSWGLKGWLSAQKISFTDILGFQNVSASIDYLYLPGTIPFTLVALMTIFLHKMGPEKAKKAWSTTIQKMQAPTIALVFAVALVSIFRGSNVNP
ncbi:MAG: L-lactate permease, partial [Bilophila sp.]